MINIKAMAVLAIGLFQSTLVCSQETIPINQGLSGTWFNQQTPGQGILLDINDDSKLFFGGWFTYDLLDTVKTDTIKTNKNNKVGSEEQQWLTLVGNYDQDVSEIPVFYASSGLFNDVAVSESVQIGTITISFSSCSSGHIDYQLDIPDQDMISGGFDITRLTPDSFCQQIIESQKTVTVTYIGNEGVFVSDGEESVLLDGIGSFGNNPWINVPIQTQNDIIAMTSPFDTVVAVTISHGHSDHFNITPVINFINAANGALLFVPQDTRGSFNSLGNSLVNTIQQRFEFESQMVGNVNIITVETRHFNQFGNDFSGIENNVYVIEIAGKRIVHMGDIDYASDNFQAIVNAFEGEVDALILPTFNTLLNQANADLVAQFFPAATIIAAHIRGGNTADFNGIGQFYPNAVVFDQPLEVLEL